MLVQLVVAIAIGCVGAFLVDFNQRDRLVQIWACLFLFLQCCRGSWNFFALLPAYNLPAYPVTNAPFTCAELLRVFNWVLVDPCSCWIQFIVLHHPWCSRLLAPDHLADILKNNLWHHNLWDIKLVYISFTFALFNCGLYPCWNVKYFHVWWRLTSCLRPIKFFTHFKTSAFKNWSHRRNSVLYPWEASLSS